MSEQKEQGGGIHITNNYYAPIGQHIDHVDTINFSMDGDGTFHFSNVGQVAGPPSTTPEEELEEEELDEMELPAEEELNLFAPAKNLKVLLQQEWFAQLRTDAKYTSGWREAFVDALMASEWGRLIALEWAHKKKRLGVRGNIIGALKVAGVLQGSDLTIAAAVTQSNQKTIKTFAVYIGRGRKKPYCDWVYDYVNG